MALSRIFYVSKPVSEEGFKYIALFVSNPSVRLTVRNNFVINYKYSLNNQRFKLQKINSANFRAVLFIQNIFSFYNVKTD